MTKQAAAADIDFRLGNVCDVLCLKWAFEVGTHLKYALHGAPWL